MTWAWGHDAGMLWWMVAGSVFWGIVVAGAIHFLAPFSGREYHLRRRPGLAGEAPLEVARRRYAAGEISEEEFRRIRDSPSP